MEIHETTASATPLQKQAACAMVNGCPIEDIPARCGVSEDELADWLCGTAFPDYVSALARKHAGIRAPYIWTALLGQAYKGNVSAIRLYFELFKSKGTPPPAIPDASPEILSLRQSLFGTDMPDDTAETAAEADG